MNSTARFAFLASALVWSACTCEPEKAALPAARVDSAFVFGDDAFAFPNFGGRGRGAAMNPDLLERLHGKADVCEPSSTEDCRLTPLAKEYMRSVNEAMEGGRCEGFAVLSGLMSNGDVDVAAFGAERGRDLQLDGNRALGGEIAYWFATQFLSDVVQESTQALSGEDAVRFLADAFAVQGAAPYRIGIARVDDAGYLTGGHAVLATGVGPGDDDGTYDIFVYDNNLPDAEKKIVVDVAAGTWEYLASTNPDDPAALYRGTPDNGNVLFVAALPPRQGRHPCPFCDSETDLQQVFGSAGAVVTVEDDSGARTGEVDGRIVDEIEDSRTVPLVSANTSDRAGTLTVLPRRSVTIAVTRGQPGATASVQVFAPNLMLAAENLGFGDDGEAKALLQTNEDGSTVTLLPGDGGGGSSLTLGRQGEDGAQTVASVTIGPDGSVDSIGITTGGDGNPTIAVDGSGATTVRIEVARSGPDGQDSYTGTIEVPAGGSATLLLDEWLENGGDLGAAVDDDGDGQPDRTVVIDQTEPLVPPATPEDLVATAQGFDKIALSWTDVATDELAYEVERDDGTGFARIAVLAADAAAFVDTGLSPATAYTYRVRATAAGVASAYSNEATATTDGQAAFAIGGTVDGLRGVVVLTNRGTGDELSVDVDGGFTFATPQAAGTTFDVAVLQQPAGQRCDVAGGVGVVRAAVAGVRVTCVDVFSVGGTVEGLTSGGLILENDGGDALAIDDNGVFSFATAVARGEPYAVAVRRQPPGHECVVEAGDGIVDGPVSDVLVLCALLDEPTFTVSVSVTGLGTPPATGLVLQNNGGDDLAIPGDGVAVFATSLVVGSGYAVTVSEQPAGAVCAVADGEGIGDGPVVVDVVCERRFVVGGTATGVKPGNLVTLAIDDRSAAGRSFVEIASNGPFVFPVTFPAGTVVGSIAVVSQPPDQNCVVATPTALVQDADVRDVVLTCVETFTVGGTIDAPSFASVGITNRVGDDVVSTEPNVASFEFSRRFAAGESYDVVAFGDGVTCTVANAVGVVGAAVLDIAITCTLAPMDIELANPSTFTDVLPADVDLAGVEFDVRLSALFAPFYGTPAGVEVRDGNGALAARGTWTLLNGSAQDARITFVSDAPAITLGAPRAEAVRGSPSGGGFIADDCPRGQVPIGFDAQIGGSVDGLSVVCGTLQVDPTTLAVTIGAGTTLPLRGGTNVQQSAPRCPTDTMLVAFTGNAGLLIDRVELECAALTVTGSAPNLSVSVGTPVPGDVLSGLDNGGSPFSPTSCAAGEVASGLTVEAGNSINALGLRCSAVDVGFPVELAAGNYQIALSSNVSLKGEAPADRIFATTTQPLRVLPRGLTSVSPSTMQQGDPVVLIGGGVAVYGDAIVAFRQGIPEALFRGLLMPGACSGPTQAGCILQQTPFTMQSEQPGVYDVCVVPGVDPNDIFGTLPASCPPGSPTLTILVRPGTPDAAYASSPLVRLPDANESAGVVAIDGDGNQYVAGVSAGEAMVAKLDAFGVPDSNYGTVGFALAGLTTAAAAPGCIDVDAQGRVTIATALSGTDGNGNPAEIHVVRFTPGGGVDDTYGSGTGTFINDDNTFAEQYRVQGCKRMSDDRLVIGASFFSTGANTTLQSIWRLDANGTFDATPAAGNSNVLNDPNFTIEEGLSLVSGPGDTALLVARLDAGAGFLRVDNSGFGLFAGNGWTPIVFDASPTAQSAVSDAVVLGDGSFVAFGASFDGVVETPRSVFVGANDVVGTPVAFDAGNGAQGPYRVAPDQAGRYVVVSTSGSGGPTLVRLQANLTNDTTWGIAGVVTIADLTAASDVVVDGSGRVLVVGRIDLQAPASAMRAVRFVAGP